MNTYIKYKRNVDYYIAHIQTLLSCVMFSKSTNSFISNFKLSSYFLLCRLFLLLLSTDTNFTLGGSGLLRTCPYPYNLRSFDFLMIVVTPFVSHNWNLFQQYPTTRTPQHPHLCYFHLSLMLLRLPNINMHGLTTTL